MSITAYMQAVLRNNKNNSLQKKNRFASAAKRTVGTKVDYTFYDNECSEMDVKAIREKIKRRERKKTLVLFFFFIALLVIGAYAVYYYLY